MIKVGAVKLQFHSIKEVDYSFMLSFVQENKRNKILRFVRYQDRIRSLVADVLVRWMICREYKRSNKDLKFVFNPFGKPLLDTKIYFNVTHSGDWVSCAVHDKLVGIDVEKIQTIDLDIAKRFFSHSEYKFIMDQAQQCREFLFYSIWTLKESYIKAIGKGLSIPLNSFNFNFENSNIRLFNEEGQSPFFFKQYLIDQEYLLSVCAEANVFPETLDLIKLNELIREVKKYV